MMLWNCDEAHDEATQLSMAACMAASCRHWQAKSRPPHPIVGAPSRKQCWAHAGIALSATEVQSAPWDRTGPAAKRAAVPMAIVESFIVDERKENYLLTEIRMHGSRRRQDRRPNVV